MRYEKPSVAALGSAMMSVRSSSKPAPNIHDNELGSGYTAAAYEADE
jgi:hypothetical protein